MIRVVLVLAVMLLHGCCKEGGCYENSKAECQQLLDRARTLSDTLLVLDHSPRGYNQACKEFLP